MAEKFWTKKRKNLTSLIGGIILILIGMTGGSISLLSLGFDKWVLLPLIISIFGVLFAYLGAIEKW